MPSGPPPKDPTTRARVNADPIPTTKLPLVRAKQPPLPKGKQWPTRTKAWWALWGKSAQSSLFTATDWDFLLDTALVHADVWGQGELKSLPELRLRMAKVGATLEDRARLRMQMGPAEPEQKTPAGKTARESYGPLTVVAGGAEDAVARAALSG